MSTYGKSITEKKAHSKPQGVLEGNSSASTRSFTHAKHGVPLGAHAVLNIGSKTWLCHSAGSLDTSRGGLGYQEALCQRNSAQKSISYGLDGKGLPARAGPISIKGR